MKHPSKLALATTVLTAAIVTACGGRTPSLQTARLAGSVQADSTPVRSLVTITYKDRSTLDLLARAGVDLFENPDPKRGTVGATLTRQTEAIVKALGVPYQVRVSALARTAMPQGYQTVEQIDTDLQALATRYPTLARRVEIGKSLEGRSIYALEITSKPDQGLPAVRINSGQHARELPPVELTMRLAHQLLEGYATDAKLKGLIDGRDIWLVPVVNPDGRTRVEKGDAMWRKNARKLTGGAQGVDTNRNCDIHWADGNSQPWADNYKGTAPFSEPESRVMRDLCTRRKFKVSIDLHNYSGMVLWPPGYDTSYTKDEATFEAIGNKITPQGYRAGTIANTIYVTDGDLATWEYATFGTLAFAAELDDSDFAAPIEEMQKDWQAWSPGLIYLIDVAGNPTASSPPAAVPMPAPTI